jgi:hypothetical protein
VPVVWAADRGRHRPDLGVVVGASRVAVEVELSHKSPRRLHAILAGHEEAITSGRIGGGLIYVSDRADVLAAVQRTPIPSSIPWFPASVQVSRRPHGTRSWSQSSAAATLDSATRALARSHGSTLRIRSSAAVGAPRPSRLLVST